MADFTRYEPAKNTLPVFIHDQCFIRQNRQVSTAGYTGAHNGRYLHNAHGAHHGVVPEDTAEVFLVRKNFVLHGEVYAGTVHQINDG